MSVKGMPTSKSYGLTAPSLPETISSMPVVERATVLIVANQLMEVVGRTWGETVKDDPAKAPPMARKAAFNALMASREALKTSAEWTGLTDAYHRQEAATDLCLLTLSFPSDPKLVAPMTNAWRAVWSARKNLHEGLRVLRVWETQNDVVSVPLNAYGEPPDDEDMLAVRLPPFFRVTKKIGVS